MSGCCINGATIADFLTGRPLPDSDDEQIRQGMERLLVEQKGFAPEQIQVDRSFVMEVDGRVETGRAELVVFEDGKPFMAVKSSRGSLVSREREALAASRLACEVPAAYTVVTNGQDAEVLDTATGKVVADGLDAVPDRKRAKAETTDWSPVPLDPRKREKEARIYLAFATFQCPEDCG